MNAVKIIGTLLIITITSIVYGQEKSVGFKFGIAASNVASDSRFIDDRNNLIGISSGLIFQVKLKNKFVLAGDLNYSRKGFVNDLGDLVLGDELASDQNEINDPEIKYIYDYLSIPLKIGYTIGDKFSFTPSIGVINSVLLSAKSVFNGNEESETKNVQTYDFGLVGGLAISYPISDKFTLSLAGEYQYGLSDITTSNYFSSTDIKHRSLSASIGLMYLLKK